MLRLDTIINGYNYKKIQGNLDVEIKNIVNDSRQVIEGSLFVAEIGYTVDGHDYIENAIELGAIAIIVEKDISIKGDATVLRVDSSADALAYSLCKFNKEPWKSLHLTGITGTNGKTSTTYFIKNILDEAKKKSGIIGTMGAIVGEEKVEVDNTTPNSVVIHELLNQMKKNQLEHCVMEVSSHALDLKRVNYMDFETGIFTNLSKDHLDYHNTIENYFQSKSKLFEKTTKNNIINLDDKYGKEIASKIENKDTLISYGINEKNLQITAKNIEYSLSTVQFDLIYGDEKRNIKLNIPGEFSVYNALAAAAFAYGYNLSVDIVKNGLESVEGIKGRFEVVPIDKEYTVIIDFAHTAEGLEKVLNVIDEFVIGKKIVLFGAGGNRDKTKRPEMGEVVGRHADISIVTSDNPRNEDPEEIIDNIIVGVKKETDNYIKIIDRIEAIHHALDIAGAGDIILLAGKGHETYTIIGDKTIPCDEREIVLDYLKNK